MKIKAEIPDGAYVPEIEQDVLGTILFGGDFRNVAHFLREEHFIPDVHRVIFRAIRAAHDHYGSTMMPVVSRLIPDDVGLLFSQATEKTPLAYMADLAGAVIVGPSGLERGAKAVISQWARLRSAEIGRLLRDTAHDATSDPKAVLQGVAADLDSVAAELRAGPSRKTLSTMDTATAAALEDVRAAMAKGGGLTGHTWGLTDINHATGGIHPGEMVIVGARPSMGKTAFALSVALRTAATGIGVGFLSLEMGSKKLAMRRLTDVAYEGRKDLGNTRKGDGSRYRGRGPLQITGRANYRAFTKWARKIDPKAPDFEANPDAINTDPWEGLGPIWYWDTRGLNRYADQGDIEMITRKINGGLNGLDDRIRWLVRASLVLLGYAPDAIATFQKRAGEKADGIGGPRTRAALHTALVAMTAPAVQSQDVQVAPVVEETEVEKPTVPPAVEDKVKEKIDWWGKITGGGGIGGLGLAGILGADWKTILAFGAVGLAGVGLYFLIRNRAVAGVREVKAAVEG